MDRNEFVNKKEALFKLKSKGSSLKLRRSNPDFFEFVAARSFFSAWGIHLQPDEIAKYDLRISQLKDQLGSILGPDWLEITCQAREEGYIGIINLAHVLSNHDYDNILHKIWKKNNEHKRWGKKPDLSSFESKVVAWGKLITRWTTGLVNGAHDSTMTQVPIKQRYLSVYRENQETQDYGAIDALSKRSEGTHVKLSDVKDFFMKHNIPLPKLLFVEPAETGGEIISSVKETPRNTLDLNAFIRKLRVYIESDLEIKIQVPGKRTRRFNNEDLGFMKTGGGKAWEALLSILQEPPHIYSYGPSGTSEYDKRRGRLREINKKFIDRILIREFEFEIPKDFRIYERCPEEGTGIYKFKFEVIQNKERKGSIEEKFSRLSKDQLTDIIYKLGEEYQKLMAGTNEDQKEHNRNLGQLMNKFNTAAEIAMKKDYITKNEIEDALRPDTEKTIYESPDQVTNNP